MLKRLGFDLGFASRVLGAIVKDALKAVRPW